MKKKTALWSITSGASFWLNSLHANRAEALCILRECTISFMLIFDLFEWHRLHVHCWFLHGSRAPHTNGMSILITHWSVCTGISYWREPSSCNLHEGTLVQNIFGILTAMMGEYPKISIFLASSVMFNGLLS